MSWLVSVFISIVICGIVLRMTWKSLGLSQKDAQFRNNEGELRRQLASPGTPGKWPLYIRECECYW